METSGSANEIKEKNDREHTDETDFITNLAENGVPTDLQALHLSLPANVNECDITRNTVNIQFHGDKVFRTSENEPHKCDGTIIDKTENCKDDPSKSESIIESLPYISNSDNISMKPAPDIIKSSFSHYVISSSVINGSFTSNISVDVTSGVQNGVVKSTCQNKRATNHDRYSVLVEQFSHEIDEDGESNLDEFQQHLIRQCLCSISEATIRKPFEGHQINDTSGVRMAMLSEWSTKRYYTRVLSSFLIVAKTKIINNEWLETIMNFLTAENIDYVKMNFALEVVKRVVEWKDIEIHVLEDAETPDTAGTSSRDVEINLNCITISFSDPESYDTSGIKGLIIKSLESRWPELIHKVQNLILHNPSIHAQTCILTFLALWESTISVKANLSVIDTKPFYAHLEIFVGMLSSNLFPIIWKQLLSLFNEVLCYGSTLALQDMLPDDTCQLAHLIVRYVKDYRLLDSLPYRRAEGLTVNSFVGTILSSQPTQKMVLLVLKSVAITIKETRSDSSDSSVGSDDCDFYQDMQLIERSIRDVLKKVDVFVKNSSDFHPETPFSKVLIDLFSDQDDYMIESMVCTLDITVDRNKEFEIIVDLIGSFLNMMMRQGCRQAREFVSGPNRSWLLGHGRNTLNRLIGVITGHCRLRRHLSLIGVEDNPNCPGCGEADSWDSVRRSGA
ncbi:hypothetical protein NQ317_003416 [Molorchus minor]|uniref:Protein Lines N-terminal domain-containing protein n=1 Tax=Molorchus minor TaxID=1323400 RepID=A0ABQ9JWM6_9CUCU|nr:hypothetical protein NQ317_003416 [Molorchus minor]